MSIITDQMLNELALKKSEFSTIIKMIGREPNLLELGLFGSLWSEHCGYKHSKPLLRMLESDSKRLLVKPGEENAGVIDIGDEFAIAFKIESHNHPSAVEPYEGAATGIGGIVRDIFAMGARPIALMNSLRFGSLDKPQNQYLFEGVVSGISGYGNCIGIPNVGGETIFDDSYDSNPLVNAMCVGLLKHEDLESASAGKPGNSIILVGAETGKDGIHGASGLASQSFEGDQEQRSSVQVGNPFLEKILIEACLEAASTNCLDGMQDLGAAGLTSAAIEAASKSNCGLDIDINQVPCREENMTPYEIMLSESQERMLLFSEPKHLPKLTTIFEKWGLQITVIGKVTDTGNVRISNHGKIECDVPIKFLTSPPEYRLQGIQPKWIESARKFDFNTLEIPTYTPSSILERILSSPNIASKESIYQQYDHQVQTNTVLKPGHDAAVLRIKGTTRAIALTTDGNGRYCWLDPFEGGKIAVAEACRNLSCSGAQPIALTDCLNFGNPEKPEIYYQLEECIKGIAAASKIFDAPVVSGNVSLYNESDGSGINPTPIIGALGIIDKANLTTQIGFRNEGDIVFLLGSEKLSDDPSSLAGSEYLKVIHGMVAGKININLDLESKVQNACRELIKNEVLNSAHDCSDGGLIVTLAEACIAGNIGFNFDFNLPKRWDASLFGEDQSRIVVSTSLENSGTLRRYCDSIKLPYTTLGKVTDGNFNIGTLINLSISDLVSMGKTI